MKLKKTILAIAVIAVVVAAVLAVLWLRQKPSESQEPEDAAYDRMTNPEYQKMLEFEKSEQKKTMGELARARQNLEEAQQANLEPEVIQELEEVVTAGEKELELERERMRANLRREIWKEQHPEHVRVMDDYRAKEAKIMADLDAAQKRLDAAIAEGASDSDVAALKGAVDELVAKLAENHEEAEKALRNLNNK